MDNFSLDDLREIIKEVVSSIRGQNAHWLLADPRTSPTEGEKRQ